MHQTAMPPERFIFDACVHAEDIEIRNDGRRGTEQQRTPVHHRVRYRPAHGQRHHGHVKALKALDGLVKPTECLTVNLGTGSGHSVLEVVAAFEKACGKTIPYTLAPRRPGDVAACYADPDRAYKLLGWRAERGLSEMCADAWRWQSQNPNGYE